MFHTGPSSPLDEISQSMGRERHWLGSVLVQTGEGTAAVENRKRTRREEMGGEGKAGKLKRL